MGFEFSKYHGAGNDFILIEDRDKTFPKSQIPTLCHRRYGIGADGLILAHPSTSADREMVYFNADGSVGEMCGNGLRCFIHFLRDELKLYQPSYKIEVAGKILTAKVEEGTIVTFLQKPRLLLWEERVDPYIIYAVDSGVPHAVIFTNELVEVQKEGGRLRHHPLFQPEGANINFVWQREGKLCYRTYERGVEDETLACGTGAVAVAFVAHRLSLCQKEVSLVTRSSETLTVRLDDVVELKGPSAKVFSGTL